MKKTLSGISLLLFLLLGIGLLWHYKSSKKNPGLHEKVSPEVAKLNEKGRKAFYQGHYHKALTFFDRAHSLSPGSTKILSNLSQVYLALDQYKKSLSCMEKALALQPEHRPFQLKKAQILKALLRFEEAEKLVDGLLEKDPAYGEARLEKATLKILKGHPEKTFEILKAPLSPNLEKVRTYLLGRAYFEKGQFEKAEGELEKISSWPQALKWLSEVKVLLGKEKEARSLLDRALGSSKTSTTNYYFLKLEQGDLFRSQGKIQEAQRVYREICEDLAKPPHPMLVPYYFQGWGKGIILQMGQGKFREALKEWSRLEKAAPPSLKGMSALWRGVCLTFLGRGQEALLLWKKALQESPPRVLKTRESYITLEVLLGKEKIPFVSSLGRRYQNNFHFFRGVHFWAQGDKNRGKKIWEKALQGSSKGEFPALLIKRALKMARG